MQEEERNVKTAAEENTSIALIVSKNRKLEPTVRSN